MKITTSMDLGQLAEHMGESATEDEARRMRDLLLRDAESYGWETTSDIEDGDWFRMLKGAASTVSDLDAVRAFIRREYTYEDIEDPLTIAEIEEIDEADPKRSALPGDFFITDEQTGCVVRVIDGSVHVIWRNWQTE